MVDSASGGPQGTTAALLNLLRGQAATPPKELGLTPVPRGCIVLTEGGEVGTYPLVVVHETIIGTGWDDSRGMVDTLSIVQQGVVFLYIFLHVQRHHLTIINVQIEDLTRHVHDFIPHS